MAQDSLYKFLLSPLRRPLRFLGSVHMAMILLVGGAIALAAGTVIESTAGRASALSAVYHTRWFDGYLLLLAINLLVAVINRMPIQRHQWSFVLTHASIILLLCGAWISRTYGYEGQVFVSEGARQDRLYIDSSDVSLRQEGPLDTDATETVVTLDERFDPTGKTLIAGGPTEPELQVLDFVPRGVLVSEMIASAGDAPGAALTVEAPHGSFDLLLQAGSPERRRVDLGSAIVELLWMPEKGDLDLRREPQKRGGSAVVIDLGPGKGAVSIELPDDLGREVPLGDGATARVTRFLLHARVAGGELVDEESAAANPAAVVEIRDGEALETHTLFALFPGFNVVRGDEGMGLVKEIRLDGSEGTTKPVVSLIVGPDGSLSSQVSTASDRGAAVPLRAGDPVRVGELNIVVRELLPHARTVDVADPRADDEDGAPCLNLRLAVGPSPS